ncbi:MAG: CDP-alcohol phosphatidyltransferase [Microbacteriaceae bacterium]|nr:CDP-alcohol phosphatidyltransferase [Microbacteriaceae bacterium]
MAVERKFTAALVAVRSAQKPGGGVPAYTRWVNRRLARYVAAAAYTAGLSPNAVSAISAVLSAIGLAVLVVLPPTIGSGLLVALLLAVGYVLDSADGQVARLGQRGGPAGEWLDHVIDAIRTPAIHLAVLVALFRDPGVGRWPLIIALLYTLVSVGQFMSQILSEQLSGAAKPTSEGAGVRQSVILIPTDMGTLCLIFVFWGAPVVFVIVYTAMFGLNLIHTAISFRRKYRRLVAVGAERASEAAARS